MDDTLLIERLAILETKTHAAHNRIDKVEWGVREDLKEIKGSVNMVSTELKLVVAWMNHWKGWIAGLFFAASVTGGVLSFVAQWLLRRLSE